MNTPTTVSSEAPESVFRRAIHEAREQFLRETAAHEMTVVMDRMDPQACDAGGPRPYRHLRFARPGTGVYAFDLVTWPGHLALSGDLPDHTFRRLYDMVEFFRPDRRGHRGAGDDLIVNPTYWGEKLVAEPPGTDHGRIRYSREAFAEQVQASLDEAREYWAASEFVDLQQAVRAELLACPPEYAEEAYERLQDFHWWASDSSAEFDFGDAWEWDLGAYDQGFLTACFAVSYGVDRYLTEFPDRLIREV